MSCFLSIYHGEYWGNMKHGSGKLLRSDGSTYHGRWEGNVVLGTGKVTFSVGDKSKKDGLPKEVRHFLCAATLRLLCLISCCWMHIYCRSR